jgi:TP901 family phage tail tape measure protein
VTTYTAVFRAAADFSGAIRQGQLLGTTFTNAKRAAESAGAAGDSFGARMTRGLRGAQAVAAQTGRAMTLGITVPVVALGATAIRTFAQFETAIVSAGSKSNATAAQLEQMKRVALDVGNTTKFSAREAAQGMDILAAAGFNANDAMKTLPAVTLAAQAANEDLGLTAETTAKAMNAFNIPVEKASHVADVFAQAANTTALDMQGLKDALGQVGEVGPRFNQTLEDTVAVVGRLVDMGVPAASAGTAVRQALTSLSAPTRQANALIDDLGLTLRDADGNMRPLPDLIAELQKGLDSSNPAMQRYRSSIGLSSEKLRDWAKANDLTTAQAQQIQTALTRGGKSFNDYAMKTLFGVEGAKAFSLAMSDGKPLIIDTAKETDKLNQLTQGLSATMGVDAADAFIAAHTAAGKFTATGADAVKAVSALGVASDGTAKKIGAAFQRTTAQKIDNLKGSIETLAITFIDRLAPSINDSTDKLTKFVTWLSNTARADPGLAKLVGGFVAVLAAIGPVLFVGSKFVGVVQSIGRGIGAAQGLLEKGGFALEVYGDTASRAGNKVRGGLLTSVGKVATFLSGPWGIAVGVGATVLGGLVLKHREAKKAADDFATSLTFENGALDSNSRQLLANQLAGDGTLKKVVAAGIAVDQFTAALTGGGPARQQMIAQLKAIELQGTSYVSTGQGPIEVLTTQAQAAKDAASALEVNGGALDRQAANAKLAADALGQTATNTSAVGSASAGATPAVDGMTTSAGRTKKTYAELNAELKAASANFSILRGDAVAQQRAQDDYKASLDSVSESVRNNRAALQEQVAAGTLSKQSADAQSRALTGNSAAARANREAIRQQIEKLNAKVQADYNSVASSGDYVGAQNKARTETKKGVAELIAHAKKAGLDKDAIQKLIDKLVKVPKEVHTDVNFDTNAGAVISKIYTKEYRNAQERAGKGVPVKADGGPIEGVGGPRQDNIAGIDRQTGRQTAWVSAGEFVVNAKAYRKNKQVVEAINSGQEVSALASGGKVGKSAVPSRALDVPPAATASARAAAAAAAKKIAAEGKRAIEQMMAFKTAAEAATAGGGNGGYKGPVGAGAAGIRALASSFHPSYIAGHIDPQGGPAFDIGSSGQKNTNIGNALRANHGKLGLRYVIRQMQITSARNGWKGWRAYHPITGSGDFRHVAHVHVSYRNGGEVKPPRAYGAGTHSSVSGLNLYGEHGPELVRDKGGSQVLTTKTTLDYLSRIEAAAVADRRQPTAAPRSLVNAQNRPQIVEGDVNLTMPMSYVPASSQPTLEAQRQLVRAGRSVRGVRGRG